MKRIITTNKPFLLPLVAGLLALWIGIAQAQSRAVISTLNPSSALALSGQTALSVNGSGFVSGSTLRWTFNNQNTPLQAQFQNAALLQATIPASLLTSPGTAQVVVVEASGLVSNSVPFTITAPVTLTGLNVTTTPNQPANVGVSLAAPTNGALDGTLALAFQPNAVTGVPANFTNRLLQFAQGTTPTTLNFTVPAGGTTATLAQNGAIQQGTVAGNIVVTITRLLLGGVNVLPAPAPSRTLTVPLLPPVIVANTVRITNKSASGFNVEMDAYSTSRDLTSATFTFQPSSGGKLAGTSFTISLTGVAPDWFSSTPGLDGGGSFHLSVPFTFNGDIGALGSVSVTLTNSQGVSSAQGGS